MSSAFCSLALSTSAASQVKSSQAKPNNQEEGKKGKKDRRKTRRQPPGLTSPKKNE
jgi:hypothetical protein